MKKKIITIVTVLLFCLTAVYADTPKINSKAAILINADSGQVLYSYNENQALPIASTTKIMTALIILENADLSASYTTSKNFANPGESNIAIDRNETLLIKDLLYALLVHSANDAAVALAEGHAGSIEAFVEQMNARASELGLNNSHFVNPHGLDAEGHAASAADLAIIAAKAMQNPIFKNIVKTKRYTIAPTNKKDQARDYLKNRNLFLLDNGDKMNYKDKQVAIYDPRIDGVKTGYTTNAQNCLVSSFVNNASRYIVVVLGAANKDALYGDTRQLVDYAIDNFSVVRVVTEGEVVSNIKVKNAESSGLNLVAAKTIERAVPIASNEELEIEQTVDLIEIDNSAILMGKKMGEVTYSIGGETIATVDLLAQRDIDERDLVGELTHALSTKPSLSSPVEVALLILKILLTLVIWRFFVTRLKRKRSKAVRDKKLAKIRSGIDYSAESNVVSLKQRQRPKR